MERFSADILRKNNLNVITEHAYHLTKGLATDNNWKRREWRYDSNFNCIEYTTYKKDGTKDKIKRSYFSEGNLLIEEEYTEYIVSLDRKSFVPSTSSIRFFYNDRDQRTKAMAYDSNGNLIKEVTEGFLITGVMSNPALEKPKNKTDKFGNTCRQNDKITYDKKTHLVKERATFNNKQTPLHLYKYKYEKI